MIRCKYDIDKKKCILMAEVQSVRFQELVKVYRLVHLVDHVSVITLSLCCICCHLGSLLLVISLWNVFFLFDQKTQ